MENNICKVVVENNTQFLTLPDLTKIPLQTKSIVVNSCRRIGTTATCSFIVDERINTPHCEWDEEKACIKFMGIPIPGQVNAVLTRRATDNENNEATGEFICVLCNTIEQPIKYANTTI